MRFLIAVLIVSTIMAGCNGKTVMTVYPDVPGYDFTRPVIVSLNAGLDEISGIVYYPKDQSVFAINDQLGVLYKIYIRKRVKIERWKFATDGDYEDLALVNNTFYVLESNGNIRSFRFDGNRHTGIETFSVPADETNEYETLYVDPDNELLQVLCKDCGEDKKHEVSAYAFNPLDQTFLDKRSFKIRFDKKYGKIKPSAAAIHPVTHELYILSAEQKALVIADRRGHVKEVYPLNPKLFKQPEGITFTPKGDLLISNEAAEMGAPNILIFTYKPPVNEEG